MAKLVRRSGRSGWYINVPVPLPLRKELGKGSIYRKAGNTHREAQQNAPRLELEIRQTFQRGTLVERELGGYGDLSELPKNQREEGNFEIDQQDAFDLIRLRNGTKKDFDELKSKIAGHDTWQVWIEKRVVAEGVRQSTVTQWRSNLKKLSKWFGSDYLQAITPTEAVAFREELLKQMEPPSAKKVLSNIKGFWTWAKDAKQVKENVWDGTTRKLKDSPKKPLPSVDVVKASDAKASLKKDYAYSILRYTGCRSNEANGLRHCDIDLKNRTINFVQWEGDGRKRHLKGKEKDERLIPISTGLYEELKDLELDGSENPIWPRQYKPKGETWGQSWASDFKHKYNAGKSGYTSHDLRRWIVTELTMANVSPFIIFAITRQTVPGSSEVVQVYVRPTLDQLREVMEKFDVLGNHA